MAIEIGGIVLPARSISRQSNGQWTKLKTGYIWRDNVPLSASIQAESVCRRQAIPQEPLMVFERSFSEPLPKLEMQREILRLSSRNTK
jgi:hypothetical protein